MLMESLFLDPTQHPLPASTGLLSARALRDAHRAVPAGVPVEAWGPEPTPLPGLQALSTLLDQQLHRNRHRRSPMTLVRIEVSDALCGGGRCGPVLEGLLMQECAKRARRLIRPGDIATRLGGRGLALLLLDLGGDTAEQVVQRVEAGLSVDYHIEGQRIRVRLVSALSIFPQDGETGAELVAHAEPGLREVADAAADPADASPHSSRWGDWDE